MGGIGLRSIQFGERKLGPDRGAAPELRFDGQRPSEAENTLLHSKESETANDARVKSSAIIAHGKQHTVFKLFDRDLHRARMGMARRIVRRFLDKPVNARLVLFRQIVAVVSRRDTYVQAGSFAHFASVPVQGGDESEVVKHGRAQQKCQIADHIQSLLRDTGNRANVLAHLTRSAVRFDIARFHHDGGERLAHFIVQFARKAAALVFLGSDQTRGEILQTGAPSLNLLFEAQRECDGSPREQEPSGDRYRECSDK